MSNVSAARESLDLHFQYSTGWSLADPENFERGGGIQQIGVWDCPHGGKAHSFPSYYLEPYARYILGR